MIALSGGTGFTGRRVAARLAARHGGASLRCLVRPTSDRSILPTDVTTIEGDLDDSASLARWLAGADRLVHCASMGFGQIPGVLAAAEATGVQRGVFVSTTAIFTRLAAPSRATRVAAEDAVRSSKLRWTIVRPTMIYGAPGDRNMERLLRATVRWPIIPVPGEGARLIQPVHVDDLADAIVAALDSEAAAEQAYNVSGRSPLSFADTIVTAARAVGRRGRRLHIPLGPVCFTLRTLERLGLRLPIREEQVLRLDEDKVFDHVAAARDLEFAPRAFEEGISAEAGLLGLAQRA